MAIISFVNKKGGASKSMSTQLMATYFAAQGKKVLIVDTDSNQHASKWSGIRPENVPHISVVGIQDGKQLGRNLKKIHEDYDFVLLDCSPGLYEKSSYSILYSDLIIIPTMCSQYDLWCMEDLLDRYEEICNLKGEVIPAYVLLSTYNERINFHKEFKEAVREFKEEYEIDLLDSTLAYRNSYRTAAVEGKSALEWTDPKAKEETIKLGKEITKILKTFKIA